MGDAHTRPDSTRLLGSAPDHLSSEADRKLARKSTSPFARTSRRAALDHATKAHRSWIESETGLLASEHRQATALVDRGFASWHSGNPIAVTIVANALLSAADLGAFVVSVVEGTATLVVFGPSLDDVHPAGPTWTANGAPTVKRRSKAERAGVHLELLAAEVVRALRVIVGALPRVTALRVALVLPEAGASSLDDAPTVALFDYAGSGLPTRRDELAGFLAGRLLPRPQQLRTILPEAFTPQPDNRAVAVTVESPADLSAPAFWAEVATAVTALTPAPATLGSPSAARDAAVAVAAPLTQAGWPAPTVHSDEHRSPAPRQTSESHGAPAIDSTPIANAEQLLATLEHVRDEVDAVAHRASLENAHRLLATVGEGSVAQELAEPLILAVARCAALLREPAHLERLIGETEHVKVSANALGVLRATTRSLSVEQAETYLRRLLRTAAKAVEAADAPAILSAWTLLVERLPGVPDGADDEAEDVARELMTMIVALRDRDQIEALATSISRSGPAVRQRFEPIEAELRELVDVAERYVQFVASNPGFTQSGLGGALGVDQQVARKIGWYLAELGVVDRVREKHSYRLYITDD